MTRMRRRLLRPALGAKARETFSFGMHDGPQDPLWYRFFLLILNSPLLFRILFYSCLEPKGLRHSRKPWQISYLPVSLYGSFFPTVCWLISTIYMTLSFVLRSYMFTDLTCLLHDPFVLSDLFWANNFNSGGWASSPAGSETASPLWNLSLFLINGKLNIYFGSRVPSKPPLGRHRG